MGKVPIIQYPMSTACLHVEATEARHESHLHKDELGSLR